MMRCERRQGATGRTIWRWAVLAVAAGVGGCAPGGGAIFEPLATPLVWPKPPAHARVQYVGQLESSADLKAGKSLGEVIFGGGEVHTMLSPYALCTGPRGRLFVADSNGQMVHVFDLERRKYESWTVEAEGRRFAQPVGIACDPRGRILVSDSVAGTIFAFDSNGSYLGDLGAEHLSRPAGIAIDPARGRLYVADPGAQHVVVLDLDGKLIRHFGRRGIELGQFNYPTNVAVDREGRFYVSDSLNARVQVFTPDFEAVRQIGRYGDMPGYFLQPKGLALDSDGHLYVVDAQFEAVQIFATDGTLLLPFGEEGTGPGQFWLPAGIHIDRNDRIWIADSYNRRVQVFDYRPEVEP